MVKDGSFQGKGSRKRRSENRLEVRRQGAVFVAKSSSSTVGPSSIMAAPPSSKATPPSIVPPSSKAAPPLIASPSSKAAPPLIAPPSIAPPSIAPPSIAPPSNKAAPLVSMVAPLQGNAASAEVTVASSCSNTGIQSVYVHNSLPVMKVTFTSSSMAQLFTTFPPSFVVRTKWAAPDLNVVLVEVKNIQLPLDAANLIDVLIQWVDDTLADQ
jgi:hypothetical protein